MPTTPEPVSQPDLNAISNDLAALKRDFAALLTDLRDGPLSSARAAVQQKAGQIGDRAADLYGQASAQAGKSVDLIAHEIEERPLTTLLLAFSVGFIASRLLSR